MTISRIVFMIILILFLSSCASQRQKVRPMDEPLVVSEEAEAMDIPSREAVFVYGNQRNLPKHLVLTIGSEPILLPSGYVRLVGVVSGGRPIACLEIGGRGLALGEGESVDGYRIVGINSDSVVLERSTQNDK